MKNILIILFILFFAYGCSGTSASHKLWSPEGTLTEEDIVMMGGTIRYYENGVLSKEIISPDPTKVLEKLLDQNNEILRSTIK